MEKQYIEKKNPIIVGNVKVWDVVKKENKEKNKTKWLSKNKEQ